MDDGREDGALTSTDALLDLTAHSLTADLGFEATLLTAVAEDLVVEDGDMAEFPGEARLTEVDLFVLDDTETETPADIHVEYGVDLHILGAARSEFPEGHTARVVVDRDAQGELTAEDLGEGAVAEEVEEAIAVTRDGVDAPREVDVDVQDLLGLDAVARDEATDLTADRLEGLGGILERVGQVVVRAYQLALQVDQADVHARALDVYADEVAPVGVEPEEQGEAPDADLQLTLALDAASVLEVLEDLRSCGDADV